MDLEELLAAGPDERWQALWQFSEDLETLASLRAVRRHGPGRLRLAALDALTYLGGEAALDPVDRSVVERLVRIRRRIDPIGPVMSCWTNWWTIRTTDQSAVLAALELTDVRPTTYNLAARVMDILEHDKSSAASLVYVGPSIDGWVPVVGPWCDAFGDYAVEVQSDIDRLSRQFGQAHAFYFGAQGDGSAWYIARDGEAVRCFDSNRPQLSFGDPLAIELEQMAAHGRAGKPEDHRNVQWARFEHVDLACDANDFAARISMDVGWRHPVAATVVGLPVLASVPGAGPVPLPAGSYQV